MIWINHQDGKSTLSRDFRAACRRIRTRFPKFYGTVTVERWSLKKDKEEIILLVNFENGQIKGDCPLKDR